MERPPGLAGARFALALAAALLLLPGAGARAAEAEDAILPPEQLDSLVAPIALYPDSLLAQVLVASTYPLELIQLQQWLQKHAELKDEALAKAVAEQPWDPSIQSMAAFPDVVKWLAEDVQWTTDLGNAFLAQQDGVMEAVQRMRRKAKEKGSLESNEQQRVETKVVEEKTVIVVESKDPEVIYVPSYSPTVVYGPPVYPYPPIYYPPPGSMFVSFSMGVMVGAAFWGGSCCGCGWGGNDVNINVNNNFNRVNNVGGGSRGDRWQHDPKHRGGTPYSNRKTADRFGGSARGDSLASRRDGARQQIARQPSTARSRGSRDAARPSADRQHGASRGSERIGGRDVSRRSSSHQGGFGSRSGGYSGSRARASSARGGRSMGGMRGGGGRRR